MRHMRIFGIGLAAALAAAPSPAGLFEDIYRGLDIFATPLGSPVSVGPAGGLTNGNRFGRLRIVPNELGQGWRVELDRIFGTDNTGRAEVFDLGNFELELDGRIQANGVYTGRGIPTVGFDLTSNAINYTLRGRNGIQDFSVGGVLNLVAGGTLNKFGFYQLEVDIRNNNSGVTALGPLVQGQEDTNFYIGPISVRGNVFYDGALALLTSLGVDTTPLEQLFPASPIGELNDEIRAALAEQFGNLVAGQVQGQTAASVAPQAPVSSDTAGLVRTTPVAPLPYSGPDVSAVPEPAAALPLLLGLLAVRRRR